MDKVKKVTTGQRLSELMKFYGISQSDIARTTGIPKTTLSQYVLDKRAPKSDALDLLSITYHVDPVWLLGYDVPMIKVQKFEVSLSENEFELIENFRKCDESSQSIIVGMCKKLSEVSK